MDVSGSWEPGVPDRGAQARGAWREDAGIQGTVYPPGWNPGPGFGEDEGFAGEWTVSTVPVHELGRRVARLLAAFAGLITLAVLAFQHGGTLAALLVLLGVPALLVTLGVATVLWVSRRTWRKAVWLEAVPLAVGMPWLGRVIWAVRAVLVGRTFWRMGQWARRPWRQPRTGDLSGTTR